MDKRQWHGARRPPERPLLTSGYGGDVPDPEGAAATICASPASLPLGGKSPALDQPEWEQLWERAPISAGSPSLHLALLAGAI